MAEYKTYNIVANGVISPIADAVSWRKLITDAIEEQFANKLDTNLLIFDRKEENVGTNNGYNILYFKFPGENNVIGFKIIIDNDNRYNFCRLIGGIYSLNDEDKLSFLTKLLIGNCSTESSGTSVSFEINIVTIESDNFFIIHSIPGRFTMYAGDANNPLMITKINGTDEYVVSHIGNNLSQFTCYHCNKISGKMGYANIAKKIQISNCVLVEKVLLNSSNLNNAVTDYLDDLVTVYADALTTSDFSVANSKAIIKSDGHTYTKIRGCIWVKD